LIFGPIEKVYIILRWIEEEEERTAAGWSKQGKRLVSSRFFFVFFCFT
jgi:hypothetical protein